MSATTPTEIQPATNPDRTARFYDRLRQRIRRFVKAKGVVASKSASFLLLAPDIFMLLVRLVTDPRVSGKNKTLLGSGVAYYLFPLDFMPEAIMGPVGFIDDLIFGVYMLNKVLSDTDPAILREHWSGEEDVLQSIQRVLDAADNLVGADLLGRIKKMVK